MDARPGDDAIVLLYDNGRFFQDCLAAVRTCRKAGLKPTSIRMNADTARAILDASDFHFAQDARLFIRIGDLPVKLLASVPGSYITFGYDEES